MEVIIIHCVELQSEITANQSATASLVILADLK